MVVSAPWSLVVCLVGGWWKGNEEEEECGPLTPRGTTEPAKKTFTSFTVVPVCAEVILDLERSSIFDRNAEMMEAIINIAKTLTGRESNPGFPQTVYRSASCIDSRWEMISSVSVMKKKDESNYSDAGNRTQASRRCGDDEIKASGCDPCTTSEFLPMICIWPSKTE
ncbi:hypothetical protein C8R44DRAFT_724667 [Mycena epipterygia]|nr:hypothetical protein C8R44DRAFT_724667 [Mycena epipterygia]